MANFKYIGDCAAGEVVFRLGTDRLRMPKGVPVSVPDFLAKKLANNPAFEATDEPAADVGPAAADEDEDFVPTEEIALPKKGRRGK